MDIHNKHMRQICNAICNAIHTATDSSNRFKTNSQGTVWSYDDDNYEVWNFGFPPGIEEKVCIQACTCTCCGGYLVSFSNNIVPRNASCICEQRFLDESWKIERNRKYREMNNWDGFDEFVDVVLPEGAPDRLCEDVIGEIFSFL